jgi:hypothetical protein
VIRPLGDKPNGADVPRQRGERLAAGRYKALDGDSNKPRNLPAVARGVGDLRLGSKVIGGHVWFLFAFRCAVIKGCHLSCQQAYVIYCHLLIILIAVYDC